MLNRTSMSSEIRFAMELERRSVIPSTERRVLRNKLSLAVYLFEGEVVRTTDVCSLILALNMVPTAPLIFV